MPGLTRRSLLGSCAVVSACAAPNYAPVMTHPATPPPVAVRPGAWTFFTADEGAAVEAMVDRIIPPDDLSAGGRDAGCALFIDRQLAGAYGSSAMLYMRPPFADGLPGQGPQSPLTPAARYRAALAAVDKYCRAAFIGRGFAQLGAEQQDRTLDQLEHGAIQLDGANARAFFELLLRDTMEGFFADPIYGGNADMTAWRMIGFPGTRYDYRGWVTRHNETYTLPPVGLAGRAAWTP